MNRLLRIWPEEDGVLSFEWTLLLTLLTIGIVAGLAGARDAIIDELGDVAEAAQGIDQSYSLAAVSIDFDGDAIPDFTTNASDFERRPARGSGLYRLRPHDRFNPGQAAADFRRGFAEL